MQSVAEIHFIGKFLVLFRNPSLKKAVTSLVDQTVVSATRFITTLLIARYAGMTELGTYSLAISIVFVIHAVEHAFIIGPYTVFGPRHNTDVRRQMAGSIVVHFALYMLLLSAFFSTTYLVFKNQNDFVELSRISLVLALGLPCLLLRDFARQFSFSHLDFNTAVVIDIFSSIIQLTLLGLLISYGRLTLEYAVIAISAGGLVAAALWIKKYYPLIQICPTRIIPDFKNNWNFGRWEVASELVFTIQPTIILWLLATFGSMQQAGIYSACLSITFLANPLILGLSSYFTPLIAYAGGEENNQRFKRLVFYSTAIMATGMLVVCILVFYFGQDLLELLFDNPSLIGHGHTINLIALALFISVLTFGVEIALWAKEHTAILFRTNVISLIFSSGFTLLFIPQYGATGAAVAFLISKALIFGLYYLYYWKYILNEHRV